jgi:CDP-glycerol glycerophosphotransferase (TagB/SpsB family)
MLKTEKRNLKRILFLFIYPFVFLLKIIPRDKNIWVFGNFKGYIDNTRYLYEYLSDDNDNKLEIYWITKDKELYNKLKSENKSVLYYYSLLSVWKSSIAGVSFFANGYSDLNKIAAVNSYVVNLWHGFPIKKLGFDAELEFNFYSFGKLNKILTFLSIKSLQFLHNKIDLYSVSSAYDLDRMVRAFNVSKDKFRITGTPRFDIIEKPKNKDPEVSDIFYKHNTSQGKNIMYAPTWRENGWSKKQTLDDPQKLISFLEEQNCYLFIKRHPLTTKQEVLNWGIKESKRINFIDGFDINESYQYVDMLITDFSSLIFDFGFLQKPIFYFITDLNEYENNRGFYDDIIKISNNNVNEDWNQLLDNLKNNTKQNKYVNHQHFDYLIKNPPNNVRKNIIKLVINEVRNG